MGYAQLRELNDKRHRLLREAREKHEEYEGIEDRTSDEAGEARKQYDGIMREYDGIQVDMDRIREDEDRTRELKQREDELRNYDLPTPNSPNTDVSAESANASDKDAYRDAFFEFLKRGVREMSVESRAILQNGRAGMSPEERALSTATTGDGGGHLIPTDLANRIIMAMKYTGPMVPNSGVPYTFNTEAGNTYNVPTVTDVANDGATHTEAAEVASDEDPDFDHVTFGAKLHTSKFVKVSVELLQDARVVDLERLLGDLLGRRIGRRANADFTTGTKGILTKATSAFTTASGITITVDEFRKLYHSIDPAYRNAPRVGWMFTDATLEFIRTLKDANNRYLFALSEHINEAEPDRFMGKPYWINQSIDNIPSTAAANNEPVLFGDMDYYWIRTAGGMRSVVARERFIDHLQIGIMSYQRMDGNLMDTAALKKMTLKSS